MRTTKMNLFTVLRLFKKSFKNKEHLRGLIYFRRLLAPFFSHIPTWATYMADIMPYFAQCPA